MYEKMIIDLLSQDMVYLKTQRYIMIDGVENEVGLPIRCSYINSENGRRDVVNDLSPQYANAILMIWGDTPTYPEESDDIQIEI
jgi:hypothetical protein